MKQLAIDWLGGRIFTDRHCQRPEDIPLAFMPLALMKPSDMKQLQAANLGLLYEYFDKAGPRSINGMPIFMSMSMLTQDDTNEVLRLVRALKEAEQAVQ